MMASCENHTTDGMPPATVPFSTLMGQLKDALRRDIRFMSVQELSSYADLLEDAQLDINTHINSLAPANRLPLEVLADIFQYATARVHAPGSKRHKFVRPHRQVSYADLIHISHVCQYWRGAALASPFLWTCLRDRIHARLDAFRARSRSVPLSYQISQANDTYTMGLLQEDAPRVRWLDINIPKTSGDSSFAPSTLQFDGSSLECLTLCARRLKSMKDTDPTAQSEAAVALFRQPMLPLRALAIRSDWTSWLPHPRLQLPNLTHLHISLSLRGTRARIMKGLLDLLANTPRAQYVYLGRLPSADMISPLEPISEFPPVSLPDLKRLSCSGKDINTAVGLLPFLRFPETVSVYMFHQYLSGEEDPDFPQYWRPLPGQFAQCFDRLALLVTGNNLGATLDGPNTGLWLEAWHQPQDTAVVDLGMWLRRLRALLPNTTHIHTFVVTVDSEDAVRFVGDVLRMLPSVVNLRIRLNATDTLCNALIDQVRLLLAPDEDGGEVCCPLLAVLCLQALQDPKEVEELYPEGIIETLRARAHAGLPVKHLAVRVPYGRRSREDSSDGGPGALLERVKAAFSGAKGLVDTLDLGLYSGTMGPFVTRLIWGFSSDEEKYWSVPPTSSHWPY